jgi:hypothetical protein
MWDSIVEVLCCVSHDGTDTEERGLASGYMIYMESFEFVIILHLMLRVLGLANGLSQALQSKDQNIMSAMNMIVLVKSLLRKLRDDGWEPLLLAATNFCCGRNIIVPNMDDFQLGVTQGAHTRRLLATIITRYNSLMRCLIET